MRVAGCEQPLHLVGRQERPERVFVPALNDAGFAVVAQRVAGAVQRSLGVLEATEPRERGAADGRG